MIRAAASPPSNAETCSNKQEKITAKNTWETTSDAISYFTVALEKACDSST